MRLKNILNERQFRYSNDAVKLRNKIKRSIKRELDEFIRFLRWYNFDVTMDQLCIIWSSVYYEEQIRMVHSSGIEYIDSFKYIKGADFYKNSDVEIYVSNETPEHLKTLHNQGKLEKMEGKFFNELVWTLSHITVHKNRVLRLKDMLNFIGYVPIKKHLTDKIETYAYDAAYEKVTDNYSVTKALYYDLFGNSPIYKKFKEKMDYYIENRGEKPISRRLL